MKKRKKRRENPTPPKCPSIQIFGYWTLAGYVLAISYVWCVWAVGGAWSDMKQPRQCWIHMEGAGLALHSFIGYLTDSLPEWFGCRDRTNFILEHRKNYNTPQIWSIVFVPLFNWHLYHLSGSMSPPYQSARNFINMEKFHKIFSHSMKFISIFKSELCSMWR